MHTRINVLKFPKEVIDKPIICHLVKKFNVEFNILQASINLQEEGLMVLELMGHKENVRKAVDYLGRQGVTVERMTTIIKRDDERCFQCGACTGICPTGALDLHRPDMAVLFDPGKCTGCGLCVNVCPVRAMDVSISRTMKNVA
ncbi:MAG: NIL domain-containing protein [Thermodesulfobacteriota bacterium]